MCSVCTPTCPDGMTDIGVSCAKHSYGRGVGRIPDHCSNGHDMCLGLCYEPCRKEYPKKIGCNICAKEAELSFSIQDIFNALKRVIDGIEGIPIVGDIISVVEDGIEKAVKAIMDAMGISDLLENLGFEAPTLPFVNIAILNLDVFNGWYNIVVEKIKSMFEFMTDWMPTIPELPTIAQCPDLVDIVKTKALQVLDIVVDSTYNALGEAEEFLRDHAVQLAIYLLMRAINRNRACEISIYDFVQELLQRFGVNALSAFIEGREDEEQDAGDETEVDTRREDAEHYEIVKAVGYEKPRIVRLDQSFCAETHSSSANGGLIQIGSLADTSQRSMLSTRMNVSLDFALRQTVKFMAGPRGMG